MPINCCVSIDIGSMQLNSVAVKVPKVEIDIVLKRVKQRVTNMTGRMLSLSMSQECFSFPAFANQSRLVNMGLLSIHRPRKFVL